ncbi:integrator complex subunit 6-B-like isoform X2 [Convolutriloba macropyga]|uniref:integrator complex subunit 6-B-like isoform X2 n=1 Tax=Convolutriloba macropyga TaxID=536237 RepID=UPI003F5273D3
MPNILFLIDNSGSMNQRSFYGTTFLDIAKVAIENFIKIRQKSGGFSADRFMLLTTEEFPKNIKVNWKDSQFLLSELKCLAATGVTLLGDGFKTAFDMLNLNRMISRIDNYGMGRNPWFLEPTLLLCLTDGHAFSSNKGPDIELTLPLSSVRGSELTSEPYRWDQRVFSLVLQIPATGEAPENLSQPGVPVSDNRALNDLCEVTGGRSYKVTSMKVLNQCLESISQKLLHGVVLKFIHSSSKAALTGFTKLGKREIETNGLTNGVSESEKSPPLFSNCQKMIIVKPPVKGQPNGQWPIPEPYFTDRNMHELCPRTSHPEVTVVAQDVEPLECDYISSDVYEIEGCPMTQSILERKSSSFAWPVFIAKSGPGEHGLGQPFGYLRAHADGRKVNLHVYPYNYPLLFPLIGELVRVHKGKPPTEWCKRFDSYISYVPLYYAVPLRESLKKLGVGHLVPESLDYYQSHSMANYLKSLSQLSKQEAERISALVARQERVPSDAAITVIPNSAVDSSSSNSQTNFHQLINSLTGESFDLFSSKSATAGAGGGEMTPAEPHAFAGYVIPNIDPKFKPDKFRNPFDTKRDSLVDQVTRMRNNFSNLSFWGRPFYDMVDKHSIAISAMGNYQESVNNRVAPLRELDPTPPRQHAFGNPYKLAGGSGSDRDKMMIDETEDFDEHQVLSSSLANQNSPFSPSGSSSGKRQAPPSPVVMYKPGKRIKPPSMPPSAYEQNGVVNNSGSSAVATTNGKVKLKPKERKAGLLKSAFKNNQDSLSRKDSRQLSNGLTSRSTDSASSLNKHHESREIIEVFDEEKWKKRTDDLVHAICRVIRYPHAELEMTVDTMCNNITGPPNYQLSVLKFLLSEAERFKRQPLIDKLKLRIAQLQSKQTTTVKENVVTLSTS